MRLDDYCLSKMVIWIRVYNLPIRAMNREMGLLFGGCVGKAVGFDHRKENGNIMGDFLRVLVEVDIHKPLRRCVMLGNGIGKKPTVATPSFMVIK
ncbi:hypothetical protein V6N11_013619 [Hibiscus sabdariffa]